MLQVTVSQATEEPLDWFSEKFGGSVKRRLIPYRGGKRVLHNWQTSSGSAERFLRLIKPYIKTKTEELELALQFRDTFLPQKRAFFGERLSQDVLDARAEMAERIKAIRIEKRAAA